MREGWEYKKLGEICTIERGGSPRPISAYITDAENGVNWIKIGDAVEGSKYISSTKEKIKPEGVKKSRFVHKGDFILSNSMSFGKPYILDVDGCIHDGWLVLHDNENRFIKDYLYYILSSNVMYLKFKSLAVGGVVNNLNSDLVKNLSVPVPPLPVQQTIVSELDTLSAIIAKYKEQLADYDKLEQSIFYDMFGDPVKNEKGWEVKKLGDVCVKIGSGATPKGGDSSYKSEGISLIRSLNVYNGSFKYKDLAHIDESQAKSLDNVTIQEDDILLNITGASVARCCIVPKDILPARVNQHVSILRVKKDILLPVFVCFQLISKEYQAKLYMISKSNGATREALTKNQQAEFNIILPQPSLQQVFADKITAIEAIKAETKSALEEAELLFNARMDYYFNA